MRVIIYIILGIILCVLFIKIFDKPMDDSGEEFNPNIFPFEIKDPNDWYNSKDKENNNNEFRKK
ncbi:MAG: hypothetical protein VB130_13990 [Clostridium sp.]|nr:hypothetical protein [Clostridium sp.]